MARRAQTWGRLFPRRRLHGVLGWALSTVLMAAGVGASDTDSSGAGGSGSQALLERLSSDDWRQRQQAEEELVRSGEAARPLIQRWLTGDGATTAGNGKALDAETRSRLEAALRRIDDNRAAGTSFVTLHLKDAPPGEVAAELFRQAGAPMRTSPDDLWEQGRWPRVTLDVDRQPFWAALKAFTGQTGVSLAASDEGLYFLRGGGIGSKGPWVVSGPFLVAATEVSRSQRLTPAADAEGRPVGDAGRSDEFAVQLVAMAEPKLSVLRGPDVLRLEEAIDDRGNPLLPTGVRPGESAGESPVGRGMWVYRVQLKYPAEPGKRIARLKGSATFAVQTAAEQIEVADLMRARDVERKLKDVRVAVGGVRRLDERQEYELKVVLYYEGPPESGRGRWAQVQRKFYEMQSRMRVLDADGQALERRGFGSRVNGDEVEMTVRFGPSFRARDRRRSGDPANLVWQVPTASKDVEVPFEFRDLPMP